MLLPPQNVSRSAQHLCITEGLGSELPEPALRTSRRASVMASSARSSSGATPSSRSCRRETEGRQSCLNKQQGGDAGGTVRLAPPCPAPPYPALPCPLASHSPLPKLRKKGPTFSSAAMLVLALRILSWLALMSTCIAARSLSSPLMRACRVGGVGKHEWAARQM